MSRPHLFERVTAFVVIASLTLTACTRVRPAVSPPAPILLAVVTWNMHLGRGDLSRLVADLSSGTLTGTPVGDYVVLLQEVTERGVPKVTTVADRYHLSVFSQRLQISPGRTTGNAMLATRPLLDPRAIDLPREREPRGAILATLDIGGQQLFLATTHLENRLGWTRILFSDSARGRQAAALLQTIPPHGHGIAGGDLNTWMGRNEPAWRLLAERFPDPPLHPQPTFRDRLVLDHIFFDLPGMWTASRRVVHDLYGSDHYPLLGLVRLKADTTG